MRSLASPGSRISGPTKPNPAKPEPSGSVRISGEKLAAGKRAPFSGILMRQEALAALLGEFAAREQRAVAEVEATKAACYAQLTSLERVCSTRIKAEEARRKAEVDAGKARDAVYERALSRCQSRSWLRSPALWGAVGAVVGAGACGLAAGLGR